jgi:hypothetical protein
MPGNRFRSAPPARERKAYREESDSAVPLSLVLLLTNVENHSQKGRGTPSCCSITEPRSSSQNQKRAGFGREASASAAGVRARVPGEMTPAESFRAPGSPLTHRSASGHVGVGQPFRKPDVGVSAVPTKGEPSSPVPTRSGFQELVDSNSESHTNQRRYESSPSPR